jgi:hypothetical protein
MHKDNTCTLMQFETDKITIDACGTSIVLDNNQPSDKIIVTGQTRFVNDINDVPNVYVQDQIIHSGNPSTYINFASDKIDIVATGASIVIDDAAIDEVTVTGQTRFVNDVITNNLEVQGTLRQSVGSVTGGLIPNNVSTVFVQGVSTDRFATLQPGLFAGQELEILKTNPAPLYYPPPDNSFYTRIDGTIRGIVPVDSTRLIVYGGFANGVQNPNGTFVNNTSHCVLFNPSTNAFTTMTPSGMVQNNEGWFRVKLIPGTSDYLFIGSNVTGVDGITLTRNVARWNSITGVWSIPRVGGVNYLWLGDIATRTVYDVLFDTINNQWYFVGNFNNVSGSGVGTIIAQYIVRYNPTAETIHLVGGAGPGATGLGGNLARCLVWITEGVDFIVGGQFTNSLPATTTTLGNMCRYVVATNSFVPLANAGPTGPTGVAVHDVHIVGDTLYFVGNFTTISDNSGATYRNAFRTGKYNFTTSTFSLWGVGVSSGFVFSIVEIGSQLGIIFQSANRLFANDGWVATSGIAPGSVSEILSTQSRASCIAIYNPATDRFVGIHAGFPSNQVNGTDQHDIGYDNGRMYISVGTTSYAMASIETSGQVYIIGPPGASMRVSTGMDNLIAPGGSGFNTIMVLNGNNGAGPTRNEPSCFLMSNIGESLKLMWTGTYWAVRNYIGGAWQYSTPPTSGW